MPPRKHRLLAGAVVVAGVIVIWALGAARQQRQAEAITREWIGDQWRVARACLLGPASERIEGADAIHARLEHQLEAALASDLPPARRWPARCASHLRTVRADPSILRADPGDALATLEALAPRVLGDDGASGASARARLLADPIVRLDAAMPD